MHHPIKRLFGLLATLAILSTATPAHAWDPVPWGTGDSQPEDIRVRLVVFGPGDAVPSWFGHGALVVEDVERDLELAYNYGMFNFDGTLLVQFATGRLRFWVATQPVPRVYELYKQNGRDVVVYDLNLSPERRMRLAESLATNARPDNRYYQYHHYYDNCATRPRDMLDDAIDGQLKDATSTSSGLSMREHTRRYTHHNPPMDFLLMFMMNDSIDGEASQWDAMFLPDELGKHVSNLTIRGVDGNQKPLVSDRRVYWDADAQRSIPDRAPPMWPWTLALGLIAGGFALYSRIWWHRDQSSKWRRLVATGWETLWGLLLGIPGFALAAMACFTDHEVTYWNENLLLANPLTLLAGILATVALFGSRFGAARRWLWTALTVTGLLAVVLKILPTFDQNNWMVIPLILPISIGFALGWGWVKTYSSLPNT